MKTKPTQHSVKEFREIGIQPDILFAGPNGRFRRNAKKKIAIHCNLDADAVISAGDVETIYEVPLMLHIEGLDHLISKKFNLNPNEPDLTLWKDIVRKIKEPKHEVTIAIVGKYTGLKDSYKSLMEALIHGGIANDARVNLQWVDSEEIEIHGPEKFLAEADGILVPGGFGYRGIEGKVKPSSLRVKRRYRISAYALECSAPSSNLQEICAVFLQTALNSILIQRTLSSI